MDSIQKDYRYYCVCFKHCDIKSDYFCSCCSQCFSQMFLPKLTQSQFGNVLGMAYLKLKLNKVLQRNIFLIIVNCKLLRITNSCISMYLMLLVFLIYHLAQLTSLKSFCQAGSHQHRQCLCNQMHLNSEDTYVYKSSKETQIFLSNCEPRCALSL